MDSRELYKATMDSVADSAMRPMSAAEIINESKNAGRKKSSFRMPAAAVVVAACVLVLGTVTVWAASNNFWGWMIGKEIGTDEAGLEELKEQGYASNLVTESQTDSPLAATSNGITVTPIAVVNDGYCAVVTFGVSGEGTDELETFLFDRFEYSIDGVDASMSGSPIEGENGEQEFKMIFSIGGSNPETLLDGRDIHIELSDIVSWSKFKDTELILEGKWEFDFNLGGRYEGTKFELNTELEGMGFTVDSIEWNPLSVYVLYTPDEINPDASHDEVPILTAVTTVDGETVVIGATGGFYDERRDRAFAFGSDGELMVDPSKVAALNFIQLETETADGCTYREFSIPLNN